MTYFAVLALVGLCLGRILPYYGSSTLRHLLPYLFLLLGVAAIIFSDQSIDWLAVSICGAIILFVHVASIAESRGKK
jgi:hypothetical protein